MNRRVQALPRIALALMALALPAAAHGAATIDIVGFGQAGDTPVPLDYDGDRKDNIAVVRKVDTTGDGVPDNLFWYIRRPGDNPSDFFGFAFGAPEDIPVPADYDGDGRDDVATFRPSNGYWYILFADGQEFATLRFDLGRQFGRAGDVPVPADYDGDDIDDLAVFRPADGTWHLLTAGHRYQIIPFGRAGDVPVPADYDGDDIDDIAVYRRNAPSNGLATFFYFGSTEGYQIVQFGTAGRQPVPGDYDGNGKADVAVYDPASGFFAFDPNRWVAGDARFLDLIVAEVSDGSKGVVGDFDGDGRPDPATFSRGRWFIARGF